MAQKVGFSLEIGTKKSTLDTLAENELQLNQINKQLREAKKLGRSDVYKSLRKQQKGLKDEAKKLNRELKDENVQLSDLVDNFRIGFVRIGDFKAGIKNAQKALGVLTKATKLQITVSRVLRTVLISSGVGALIVALGSLVAWLTQTQAGIDFVKRGLESLKAGITAVVDTFARVFTEGLSAFKGLGSRVKDATTQTYGLVAAEQALREERRALGVETEKNRTRQKELSKIAEDTSKSNAERSKAAAEGIRIEQELLKKREDFANRELENLKKQVELKGSLALAEDLDKIADKEKEIADIREESVERQTTLNSKLNVANQALSKELDGVKQAAEGSLNSLVEKIGKLNDEIAGSNLTGNALRDKIREIVNLEQEVENLNTSLLRTRNELNDQGPLESLQQDPNGAGFEDGSLFDNPLFDAEDPRITREKEILDQLRMQREEWESQEREGILEAQKQKRELEEQYNQQRIEINNETYEELGKALGEFATSETATLKGFAKDALGILVDFVSKQINLILLGEQAKAFTNPASAAKFAIISGLIKAILGKVKSSIQKLEDGGQLNPGFVASGPRHAHGGINIGNGQEIEGGEPVLTRRAAQLFPNELNAINMAAGGRRILRDGGILGTAGPLLPSSFLGSDGGVDGDALAEKVAAAVYQASSRGIGDANRRMEREQEFQNRTKI